MSFHNHSKSWTFLSIAYLAIFLVLWLLQISLADAASRRVQEYGYDAAGNITDITSQVFTNPPDVISLNPNFINIGRSVNMTASGTDLLRVQVTTPDSGLLVSNVTSTLTQVIFTLTATDSAAIGTATLIFTTGLGSDSETITVADRAPDILTIPNPIALEPNGQAKNIQVVFDTPQNTQKTYNLAVGDTTIASLGQTTITLPAGETIASFNLTGLLEGNTELIISSTTPLFSVSFPVFVAAPFSGQTYNASYPVGIIVGTEEPSGAPETATLSSTPVGLIVGTEDPSGTPEIDTLHSSLVGLIVGTEDPTGAPEIDTLHSPLVGLIVGTEDPTGTPVTDTLHSSLVGLIVGTEDPTGAAETA